MVLRLAAARGVGVGGGACCAAGDTTSLTQSREHNPGDPNETAWAKLLAQLVVFKEESRGSTAVPHKWGKKMNKKFGTKQAPDWWSEALATWASNQRQYGKAFKKPASERSATEETYAGRTTERRVALLDGIGFFT